MLKRYQGLLLLLLITIITSGITFFSSALSADQTCVYHEEAYQGINLSNLGNELETTGLLGEIHGVIPQDNVFVLSVRDPDNFFKSQQFSVIPGNNKTQDILRNTDRHDQVCLQGKLVKNPSPQPHIVVKSAVVMESWNGLEGYKNYEYQANIPVDLKYKNHAVFKVHAIDNEGKILVVEYKDKVIPIFVNNPELTKDLYRGDLIDLSYTIQSWPKKPTHLNLNLKAKNPLKVVDQLVAKHEIEETLTGKLVKFPQSPQIKFDVYAIEVTTQGLSRYYTLVNFEDAEEFEIIREKLATIWKNHLETVKAGRNFLINPNVMIKAQGKINIISPQQANPQILLENANKIQVIS
ncbi:hypothetical protein [Crocosphaera chwakensis]|uniref:Uncharacterized protein n=1 Tax=Crocosphaera chwakensis CCY0110 TaxID=391612 RepID=A3IPE9_9CHRO|nr:hypothetical protein [Crocosphaera chwakensis]EAZ91714.1 hypothetical protein CY0110_26323 [Crocosphaera chwakensis CCY0110]